MEHENDFSIKSTTESDDDYGCYFLQPSPSPYNLAEKLQQANMELCNASTNNDKAAKVKFKDELVSYEPDLTDDDVNSIESDHIEIITLENPSFEYKTSIINPEMHIFDIEEEEDEIIEEIPADFNAENAATTMETSASPIDEESNDLEEIPTPVVKTETVRISSAKSAKRSKRKRHKNHNLLLENGEVTCKNHCIDKLDLGVSMSVKKLEIPEKPTMNFPPLKLHQRKCCNEQSCKPQNLPVYNGLRSEYGLTQSQLQKREKRKETIKLKEQTREKLKDEYKNRKMQQNEEVFCQWLKDVSRRKTDKEKRTKQSFTPNSVSLPNKSSEKVMQRPKTANEFVPRQNIKKRRRPHSTQSCVFIEVPENVLRRGLHVGDLLVTNSNLLAKKLHILTLS